MARRRNPNRDKAKKQWLESGGTLTPKELATIYGVPEARVRKWKSEDKWKDELSKKHRGGQKGNRNAAGHGAPTGNKNAETHGAYSRVHLENLSESEREYIEALTVNAEENMLRELQLLTAKERDLARRINEYQTAAPDAMYIDRIVEMNTPPPKKDKGEQDGEKSENGSLKMSMQTVIKASPFERSMRLEAEYSKVHGRILKLIDAMRAHEIDRKRIDLEERKYNFAKQRAAGEFSFDPEAGEIIDSAEDMSDENDI